jgi:hypothetical protein
MINLKFKFLFIKKNSLKSLYLVTIFYLTHLHVQDGNTKVKFMLRIFRKIHEGSEIGSESGYGYETN